MRLTPHLQSLGMLVVVRGRPGRGGEGRRRGVLLAAAAVEGQAQFAAHFATCFR